MGRKKKQAKRRKQRAQGPPAPAAKQGGAGRSAAPPTDLFPKLGWPAAIAANLLILSTWVYAFILQEQWRDFYSQSAQEDEYLEWGTFWAFILAAVVFVVAAVRQRRATGQLPWFVLGVSAFCFVVAMEEISWAQRVFAYRPPEYFLEHNFQQELNFHNVMSTKLRKLAVKGVLLGYGVVLPLAAALVPAVRKLLSRAAVVVPPAALAPSFAATYWFYEVYPWKLTGEWAELMMGLGFLFSGVAAALHFGGGPKQAPWLGRLVPTMAASWLLVVAVGVANAAVSRFGRSARPETIATAEGELEALKRDFLSGEVKTKCNRHRRLYTFMERYDQDAMLEGEFAALTAQGLPEERAEFFLDPWNSPYWIRDRCKSDDSRRVVFIYSFGPNRRRESSRYEILGDDVGIVVYDGAKVRDIVSATRASGRGAGQRSSG